MRVAMLTPLPPVKSGIAHYASMLLPALARRCELTAVTETPSSFPGVATMTVDAWRPEAFDATIYQLGNNPFHEFIYRQAIVHPGVTVLHEVVMHHLIVEMTLARGDADGYVAAMAASHGAAGAAWARGRAAGWHLELANFLMPASIDVANRSRAVIVHNRYAASRLHELGVTSPIHVVPHPFAEPRTRVSADERSATRTGLGLADDAIVAGVFGFLTAAKRIDVIFDAFARARASEPRLRLLLVGEPAPNVDLEALAARAGVTDGWSTTGYVADEDFDRYLAAVDRVINLRYPSAGETSGALIRVFAVGKPVAVSDYAQFAEFPGGVATRIAFGSDEPERLAQFLLAPQDEVATRAAQREWLDGNARTELTVEGYLRAIEASLTNAPGVAASRPASAGRELSQGCEERAPLESGTNESGPASAAPERGRVPLFARVSATHIDAKRNEDIWHIRITLRNEGDALLRAATWGEPGYRLVALVLARTAARDAAGPRPRDAGAPSAESLQVIHDEWLALPRDLAPGETCDVELRLQSRHDALELRLFDAIEGIPAVDTEPWMKVALP
jgi:glycosyltransferase involved in cell wall biosynthesis